MISTPKHLTRRALLVAIVSIPTLRAIAADRPYGWHFPPVTYDQPSGEFTAQGDEQWLKLIAAQVPPGGTSVVVEGHAYVGPKKAPLSWRVEVSQHATNYLAILQCIGTETCEVLSKERFEANSLRGLFGHVNAALRNRDNSYEPAPMDDEGIPTKLGLGIKQMAIDVEIPSNNAARAQATLDELVAALMADKSVSFCERVGLGDIIAAQDASAANAIPFQFRTGRIFSARYVISPAIAKADTGMIVLRVRIIDTVTGAIRTTIGYAMDGLPSGTDMSADVKAALNRP